MICLKAKVIGKSTRKDTITSFLDSIDARIVFESGYKYQHLYDVLDNHGMPT